MYALNFFVQGDIKKNFKNIFNTGISDNLIAFRIQTYTNLMVIASLY